MSEQPKTQTSAPGDTLILVIDVQSTGDDCLTNEMPCFGAAIVNLTTNMLIESKSFYIHPLNGDKFQWSQKTLDEFWNTPANIEMKNSMLLKVNTIGTHYKDAMNTFYAWVRGHTRDRSAVVFYDTAGFDATFMNVYMSRSNLPSMQTLFGSFVPTRDSSSVHAGVARLLPSDGLWGMERAALAGIHADPDLIKKNPYAANHDPLSDVLGIAWEIMLIVNAIRRRRGSSVATADCNFCRY